MTDPHLPSFSYGTGYLDDFAELPPTGTSSADPLTGLVEEILYDDWLRIYGVPNSANDEYRIRYTADLTSLGIGSTLYNKWRLRVKTEATSPGLGIQISIEYTDAEKENLFATPKFTDGWWNVYSGSLTKTGKTVKYINYILDDYPDSVAATGQSAWFDFFMLYKGDFPLPNTAHGAQFNPPLRYAKDAAPRMTDIIQNLGAESASFECQCDLDVGTWKRVLDTYDAQVIHEVIDDLCRHDFLWLDTGVEQFKAILERNIIDRKEGTLDLKFTEYSRCDATLYSYIERFGLNL